jgi:hypothetical protein
MNALRRTFEKHSEAEACYRELKSQGCMPRMYLNYAGDGIWVVATPAA